MDYAANQGVEWVILTNGITWRLYEVVFAKPIDRRLLVEIDLTTVDLRRDEDLEKLYLLTKEGFSKGVHLELRDRRDASSRFMLASLLLNNESVLSTLRRELRRVVDVLVDESDIIKVLRDEVIKRDTLEGPEAEAAAKRVSRKEDRPLRATKAAETSAVIVTKSAVSVPSQVVPATAAEDATADAGGAT